MKAVICKSFGDLNQVAYGDFPDPVCGPNDVLIKVRVATVSYMDWLMTDGRYQLRPDLPYVPGTDAAGVVQEVGREVNRFKPGDRVACSTWHGAYAELMAAPEGACSQVPDNVPDLDAANVIYAYGTAHYGLIERAKLTAGETLLVTGATGGVGLAALEIGKLLGARIIAGVGSDEKRDLAKLYGADAVINYRSEDVRGRIKELTDGQGIDVCFELIGGELFETMARSMNWNGRLLPIGFASGEIPSLKMNLPLVKNFSIVGSPVGPWWERCRAEAIKANDELFQWLSEGKIHPKTDSVMPFKDATKAMRLLQNREVKGRIALSVSAS
ncbi:NADPH:quinone oxidoreductase family protein [Ruegeria litorea]|uniref:NADPH:quinone oxidoreductase family protein n=1 Tax=Falsiruegeria litorea TaxID=1280831 RepID=A0ABS5WL83_9RHOB|nr:NADPH:quinone oxidoreductase family protein [Falsiruegeria litorea]MBT3139501.1 NADPH:quinone oxidoreductase family protein [Falsiruegeria litorea]